MRKDVAQDEEVVEEDVRREEVDIDNQTERRGALGRDAKSRRRAWTSWQVEANKCEEGETDFVWVRLLLRRA